MADYLQDLLDRMSVGNPDDAVTAALTPPQTDDQKKKKKAYYDPTDQQANLPAWAGQAGAIPTATTATRSVAPESPVSTDAAIPPVPQTDPNPLGTYSPDELGTSPLSKYADPIVAKLHANLVKFGQAKGPGYVPPEQPAVPAAPQPQPTATAQPAPAPAPAVPQVASPESAAAAAQPPQPTALSPQTAATNPPTPPPEVTQPQEKVPLPRQRPAAAPPREPSGDPSAVQGGGGTPTEAGGRPLTMQEGQGPTAIQADRAGMLPSGGNVFGKIMEGLGQHSNLLLAMGAGLMGAPNVWQGLGRGFAFAGPAAQQDIKTQQMYGQQQAVVNALMGAGAPANLAQAAALDPDIKKQMLQTYIADRGYDIKPVESTNFLGDKVTEYWAINKYNPAQSFKISPGAGGGPAGPVGGAGGGGGGGGQGGQPGVPSGGATQEQINALGQIPQNYDQNRKDENFLNEVRKVDPTMADAIVAMDQGRNPPRGKGTDRLLKLAERYDNNFDANKYRVRQDLQDSYFGKGEGYNGLLAANTAIHHGVRMEQAINDLHNMSIAPGFLNKVTGKISEQYNQRYQAALANFEAARTDFSEELEKALTGKSTRGGQADIREGFDPYGSNAKNMATLRRHLENLSGRIEERENAYRKGMGVQGDVFGDMLSNRPALEHLLQQDQPQRREAATAGVARAQDIKPGSHVILDAQGNIQQVLAPQQ